ncbi:MAG: CRISPR-associated helicase Cas3' [Caulobacteraceae bacterium]
MSLFAHSLPGKPTEEWEPLEHHLEAVGRRAAEFAQAFGWAEAARVAGRLHDIGKCSGEYQAYIARPRSEGQFTRGPDHSTAGAREACRAYPGWLGRMLAFAIAGHHAGLADFDSLDRRLDAASYPIKPYAGWQERAGDLAAEAALKPTRRFQMSTEAGFTKAFLGRMIFSCLVDADFLETERFYAEANGEPVDRGGHLHPTLRERLRDHMASVCGAADPSAVNLLRAEVLGHAISKAGHEPGLFTLTVPTGGGKTLASLSFALDHAMRHGLRRVIYVIPFTSIIEQTAQVFREALRSPGDVLEHHASFDWERQPDVAAADSEGPDGLRKLRRAAENWDAPIVVTTAVQFFESLFAARTSPCRKLHNIAGSVIILDEAQTLPIALLRPCMAALDELALNYRTSVVLCTATQPALRKKDEFERGLDVDENRELAPDPQRLYQRLKRVTVEHLPTPTSDQEIATRFAEQEQMLCIVNSRAHARDLYEVIRDLPGAVHLTTLMCPRHRSLVLADIRRRLKNEEPVRLVATSLIEAGVDVDFPEVWRAAVGLDSIAQAAGRCNREGKQCLGRTVVFTPTEAKPPHEIKAFWQAARGVLRDYPDPLCLDAVRAYFRELYWQKGDKALDAARLDGERWPILAAISERAKGFNFEFEKIARAFRMIELALEPIVVPWKEDRDDDTAEKLLMRIASSDRPRSSDLRRLHQYTVPIPPKLREQWLGAGVLREVHPRLGAAMLRLNDLSHYAETTGLDIRDPFSRSTESNVIA